MVVRVKARMALDAGVGRWVGTLLHAYAQWYCPNERKGQGGHCEDDAFRRRLLAEAGIFRE